MKKSFTLIELLLSIIILSIMVLGLSSVIKSLNKTEKVMHKIYQKNIDETIIYKVLYNDILNSENIVIKQTKNYSTPIFQTSNSLHNIAKPYVMWYISKNRKTLMRMETPTDINLSNISNQLYYLDKFNENTKIFKIYKNRNKFLIFLQTDQNIYFEITKN